MQIRITPRALLLGLTIAMILIIARLAEQEQTPEVLLPPGVEILDSLATQTMAGEEITFIFYRDEISTEVGQGVLRKMEDGTNRIGFTYVGRIAGSEDCQNIEYGDSISVLLLTCNGLRLKLDLNQSGDVADAKPVEE